MNMIEKLEWIKNDLVKKNRALEKIARYHCCERHEMTDDETIICPHCTAEDALSLSTE